MGFSVFHVFLCVCVCVCVVFCLQDKGEVPLCIRRYLPVLWGLSPLGPLYVPLDLQTLHTGTFPGCAIHPCKTLCQMISAAAGVCSLACWYTHSTSYNTTLFFFFFFFRCTRKQSRSWKSYQNPSRRTSTLRRNPDQPHLSAVPCTAPLPAILQKQQQKKNKCWLWLSGWGCFCCT